MKRNYLKGARVVLAILVFLSVTLFFVDSWHVLPASFHSFLHWQFVPAVLAGMWSIVVALLLLAFIFGRVYCSVICPAGILQDIFIRLSRRRRAKNKRKHGFRYRKAYNLFRYVLLAVVIITFLWGVNGLLVWLDPYSNYGRIASNLFRPVVIWINNGLAAALTSVNNYTLYHITIRYITVGSFAASLAALIVFAGMSVLRGRLFCNTLCPVGAVLSIFSRYSLFRISFDKTACNSCGNCERTCKAECIDSREQTVDGSRCIACFDCISSCKKGGLQYRFIPTYHSTQEQKPSASPAVSETSRRTFLAAGTALLGTVPLLPAWARSKRGAAPDEPLIPPGAVSKERFTDLCTACHLCVVKCPNQVLKPAGLEYGWEYMLKPHVVYDRAYCNYECTVCSEVCPTSAIRPLTTEEKATTQVGIAHFEKDLCVVYNAGTDCGACSEHCPTQAVRMVPYKGTLRIPQVDPAICIGCGGCEYICPVRPDRAIHVVANTVQQRVRKPEYEQVEEKQVDDFGF